MIMGTNVNRFLDRLSAGFLFPNQLTRACINKFDPAELTQRSG